jgi:hypothetical protein
MEWLLGYLLAFATAFAMLQYLLSRFRAQATIEDTRDYEDDADHNDSCRLGVPFDDDEYDEAEILAVPQPGMEPQWSEYVKRYDGWRPELRAEFALGPGGFVRGWPSKGGLYVLDRVFGVELEYLGLDRFNNTPRPSISDPDASAEEEEMHCNKSEYPSMDFARNTLTAFDMRNKMLIWTFSATAGCHMAQERSTL